GSSRRGGPEILCRLAKPHKLVALGRPPRNEGETRHCTDEVRIARRDPGPPVENPEWGRASLLRDGGCRRLGLPRILRHAGVGAGVSRSVQGAGPGRPGWLPTQVPHRSGRVKQETHLVTPPRPTFQ